MDLQRSSLTGEYPLQIYEEIARLAREHCRMHSENNRCGRSNGRQMRNSLQSASALAFAYHHNNQQQLLLEDPDAKPSMPMLGV
ncbi:hypothetical protein QBC46DRAFT_336712 [Diplogelasinospora grovesii]|uniref:Uncharacterized protein n=1 Tax=Diplogelasinospora grovesii TaxID=303347 RepID=A0AAN6NGI1_9PEZI|nr:hypothetical protein QBC46DRAFT_336712 [Diplogelasinospora grovesii]